MNELRGMAYRIHESLDTTLRTVPVKHGLLYHSAIL